MNDLRAKLTRYGVPLLVLVLLAALFGHRIFFAFKSDREKIEYAVHSVFQGARKRQIGDMLEHVSEDYSDRFHPDKRSLRRTLLGMWQRFRAVQVRLQDDLEIDIAPDGDTATVDFAAQVLLGRVAGEPPADDFVYQHRKTNRFRLRLQKEGSVWRVTRCEPPEA